MNHFIKVKHKKKWCRVGSNGCFSEVRVFLGVFCGGMGWFWVVWDDSMDRLLIVDVHQIHKKSVINIKYK